MQKTHSGKIRLRDIKHIENSRMRGIDDVSDLMQDLQQRGLLENIGIRESDNALIFGNRRVTAAEKIGWTEIPCDFYADVSDEELLITNLAENMKRKNIGCIEIGRIVKILLNKGLTKSEIAVKLAITPSRVRSALSAYDIVVGTPFENLIVFGKHGPNQSGIPEHLIWKIQNSLTRAIKLTKKDWDILLRAVENGKLTSEGVSALRKILISDPSIGIVKALDILDRCKIIHVFYGVNYKELHKCMAREKIDNEIQFFKHIVNKYNSELLL